MGAILPVDIYGRSAQYSDLVPIADEYGLPVLADSAESLGSHHAGKMAGAWGDLSALSFNGNKIITTSGGGMLVTSSADHARYVRYLATQAREPGVHYEHVELGYNYRLSNISAALGRAQLTRLPSMIEMRRARRLQYEEFFSHVSGVSILSGNIEEDNCWLTFILVDEAATGWSPLELMDFLALEDIKTRPMWKPMHLQPLYRDAKFIGGNVAETMFRSGLALPSGSSMSDYDMDRVLGEISNFLGSRA